jgi:hypothetical protein
MEREKQCQIQQHNADQSTCGSKHSIIVNKIVHCPLIFGGDFLTLRYSSRNRMSVDLTPFTSNSTIFIPNNYNHLYSFLTEVSRYSVTILTNMVSGCETVVVKVM